MFLILYELYKYTYIIQTIQFNIKCVRLNSVQKIYTAWLLNEIMILKKLYINIFVYKRAIRDGKEDI